MSTIESSGSPKSVRGKTGWVRRAVLGVTFAAVGLMTLGGATTPAQAYWYGYGYYHPYRAYYYPHYYGWYGYPAYYGGWGWRGGWGWGWRHGYYHHW
jgi:hypothetical protein